jgi:hypothetical protein
MLQKRLPQTGSRFFCWVIYKREDWPFATDIGLSPDKIFLPRNINAMKKLDLTQLHRSYYSAKTQPELTEVDAASFLSILGQGDPSSATYAEKVKALYTVAYSVKQICKLAHQDFVVPKLEGLWWYDEDQYKYVSMDEAPTAVPRDAWHWKLLIRMPETVSKEVVNDAIAAAVNKKKLATATEVQLFSLSEGKVVQMLHVGPFSEELITLKQMKEFIDSRGLKKAGLHHEIYLSDFNRTPPERLKTILREPVH